MISGAIIVNSVSVGHTADNDNHNDLTFFVIVTVLF